MRLAPISAPPCCLSPAARPPTSQGGLTLEQKLPATFAQLSNVVELGDGHVAFADTKAKLFLTARPPERQGGHTRDPDGHR